MMKTRTGRQEQRGTSFTHHALSHQREQWAIRLRNLLRGAYAEVDLPKRPRTET